MSLTKRRNSRIPGDEWNVVRECEKGDVEEEWQLLKSAVIGCTETVCGIEKSGK